MEEINELMSVSALCFDMMSTKQTDYHLGTWCSGITPALHAEGPGFNPQSVHFAARARDGQPKNIRTPTAGLEPTTTRLRALRSAG